MRLDQSKARSAFSKNGFEFSGSKIDRQFSYSKLNRHFAQAQQQTRYRATLAMNFNAAIGNYRSAFTYLFGSMGGGGNKGQADASSINFGGNIGALPLPPMIHLSDYPRPSCNANPAKAPKNISPASRHCSTLPPKRWPLQRWNRNAACVNAKPK